MFGTKRTLCTRRRIQRRFIFQNDFLMLLLHLFLEHRLQIRLTRFFRVKVLVIQGLDAHDRGPWRILIDGAPPADTVAALNDFLRGVESIQCFAFSFF